MPKKKSSNLTFILISFFAVMFLLLVINTVKLFLKPTQTVLVKNGELTKYEEVIGYIIRDEVLIDNSDYEGVLQTEIEDGTRVAKSSVIATYVSKSQEELVRKIQDLDVKIQEAMNSQPTIYSSDVKALDSTIQIQLYDNFRENTNINLINEGKSKLNANIKKKAQILGEYSAAGSKVKELINQRTEYEKEINDAKKELTSPIAGLISYRIDGFEETLTKRDISDLKSEKLDALKINVNQIIPQSDSKIKIVDNFECYIAMFLNSEESKAANLNDRLYLRFENTGERLIPATVQYILEEENGRLITVKIETNIEELTKYRKINLDVVWWTFSGLKLHKSLLSQKNISNSSGDSINTLNYVTIKRIANNDIAYVKIVKEFGDYVIVENYTDEEYRNLGFSEDEIASFTTLKVYNEVVVEDE